MVFKKLLTGIVVVVLAAGSWAVYQRWGASFFSEASPVPQKSIYLSVSPPVASLALGEQVSLQTQLNYSDGSHEILTDVQWQCDDAAVSVGQDAKLQAQQVGQAQCEGSWKWLTVPLKAIVSDKTSDTVSASEPYTLSLAFLDHLKGAEPAYGEFKQWVDKAVAGKPGWGFSATDAVYMYYLSGESQYIQLAIQMVDQMVAEEEAAIAACVRNNKPSEEHKIRYCPKLRASFNSYLRVSSTIVPLAYTYAWAKHLLSDSQQQRWEQYADQAIFNIWNRQQASWGGVPFKWSGWGVDVAGSNYFFSFIEATMSWAIASNNQQWLSMLANEKMPLFEAYFTDFEGGGSREGTNYGVAQRQLFRIYNTWYLATGEDMVAKLDHVKETIDYWIHATLPTLDLYAPYGDQSRVSYPALYDYYESVVQIAASLNLGTEQAKRARWWIDHNSVKVSKGNLYSSLYQQEPVGQAPSELVYHAKSAAQLFVRSSWEKEATWLAVVAGIRDEPHSHREHGAFTLYKHDWLAVTENIWSHSGIHRSTEHHNILRFVHQGKNIKQGRPMETLIDYQHLEDSTRIQLDLSPAYTQVAQLIQHWQREIILSAEQLRVKDHCQVANDVKSIWQVNVPVLPEVQADGSIKAGQLLIRPLQPSKPEINIVDWKALNPKAYKNGGYKVELSGGCEFEVLLTWPAL